MNFGRIINADCVNLPSPPDPRCEDAAFALSNPDVCPVAPQLVIKPAVGLICALGSVQLRAFLIQNNKEIDVTDQTIFRTSDGSIALVGAASGNATGLTPGNVTISAAYQDKTAFAKLTVIAPSDTGDCCGQISTAFMVLVDNSRSQSQSFSGSYSTKLIYSKAAAVRFINEVNVTKDIVGLIVFSDDAGTVLQSPTIDKAAVAALAGNISQSQNLTEFYDALNSAVTELQSATADQKVIVLISDGVDQTQSYLNGNNPIALLSDFKAQGGIVICLGVRAHDRGYNLLESLSTGGFFLNAYEATQQATLDYFSGMKGYICGGNCTPDGDSVEHKGALNYTGFINWDVIGGTVDLQGNGFFDFIPGNGLYVDMAGSTPSTTGKLQSKTPFNLTKDSQYRVAIDLSGNQREEKTPDSVRLRVFYLNAGNPVYLIDQKIVINDFAQPFQTYAFSFTAQADVDAYISIQQEDQPSDGDARIGLFLGRVKFDNTTNLENLLDDNFDAENPVYVPPKCGSGYYAGHSYEGYDCYGIGCLETPPPIQLEDPNQLPDIEAGFTPPTTYTSSKQACASCPSGSINVSPETIIPKMTANNAPSGLAFATNTGPSGPNPVAPFLAFDQTPGVFTPATDIWFGVSSPCTLGYKFASAVAVPIYRIKAPEDAQYNVPGAWTFEGSNDGLNYTVLDTQSGISWFYGETKTFQITNSTAYQYYRLNISAAANGSTASAVAVDEFELSLSAQSQVCKTATAESTISQADADNKAYAAALALANAELNCVTQYTSTEQYTATCPVGSVGQSVTKSASATSLVSQADADAQALAAAKAAAEAELDCGGSNNTQKITITDSTGQPAAASPYPSVKHLSGLTGHITKVTCTITGFTHTSAFDVAFLLRSPSGTCVLLMLNCGGHLSASNLTIIFDDAAATALSAPGPLTSGTFKPNQNGPQFPFPAPVEANPYQTALSAFIGEDANGSWSLWVCDSRQLDIGQIASGWNITITSA
jgi:hypothetical protein